MNTLVQDTSIRSTQTSRPRVTVLVSTFPDLTETFVMRQVLALGADVVTGLIDPISLQSLPLRGDVVTLDAARPLGPGRARQLLGKVMRPLLGIPIDWSGQVEGEWRAYLRRSRPDVVLAQFGPNALRGLPGCEDAGIPLVAHFHGYDASGLIRDARYVRRLAGLFEKAAAVIVVSEAMRATLLAAGCPPDRVSCIPCGVPIDEFEPADDVTRSPCRFVAVGRFVPKKAPLTTLRAFERCLAQAPGITLRFVGDGPLLLEAASFVEDRALGSAVSLLGVQNIDFVRSELRSAGAFLQHSVTAANGDTEGWPVSIAEAAACALPVVSTRHAGIPEEVVDGETGFLVDESDEIGMADRMMRLALDPSLRLRMGRAAREHIRACGDAKIQLQRLAEVLATAASASKVGQMPIPGSRRS